jgi:hypothetical protein
MSPSACYSNPHRKGAKETQRKPNEACQKAGGMIFAATQSINRRVATIHFLSCLFTTSYFAFLCVSFAPLRLCGEDLVRLCG